MRANSGVLETAPAHDYDDSYIIEWATRNKACIVSNDKFRDQKNEGKPWRSRWLKRHLISYAFIRQDFIPNPDFLWPSDYHHP